MPGGDGTGPRGEGSMTGGGRGFCAQPIDEKDVDPNQPRQGGFWRGIGRRFGFGRGWGRGLGRGAGRGPCRGFGW
ncbi:hypothetical protein COT42_07075 [Candidatus Saganbacteria bacterium CG08_land_8_20_14_0_20_45_16]|uniref:Uncharacterized protein n=1 Tax=Candidatus Saganbacteria bacterium CG08_land_8_20_14_0_20_45_16 TaxID=2014293 RepID=A0A2H0XUX5_UNCSA|nr:MAG: hypothetical protein COT42_07075 [Candidatus Saganbacteria bacterium CG08_land_8_20_14_0_20_45_16]